MEKLSTKWQDVSSLQALPKSFYLQDTLEVAKQLLGKGLFVRSQGFPLLVQLVEVEAYLGDSDPASHAHQGPTRRNKSMFERGGTCYVYLSYGINFCMNVVTQEKNRGEAVLLRGAVPLIGMPQIQKNRRATTNLLNGPGRLTQGLGIDLSHNGLRFDHPDLKLLDLGIDLNKEIGSSPRIGISKAKDCHFRFFVRDSSGVSRKGMHVLR